MITRDYPFFNGSKSISPNLICFTPQKPLKTRLPRLLFHINPTKGLCGDVIYEGKTVRMMVALLLQDL
jgi:hypothetical protein